MGGFFIEVHTMEDSIDVQNDMPEDQSTDQQDGQSGTESTESGGSLSAGFARVRGEQPHTTSNEKAEAQADGASEQDEGASSTDDAQVEQGNAEAKAEDEHQPEEYFAGMKASEVKALLAKAAEFDRLKEQMTHESQKMYGKFGEFQKKINQLQQQSAAGQPVKLTKESLKRTLSDYPELAEALADDLGEILKSPASGLDQANVDTLVSEKLGQEVAKINQANEQKLLAFAHRDYKQVLTSDDFKIWRGTLPADVQQALDSTWDAVFVADAITEFKTWKQKSAADAEEAKTRRTKRLENAVVPNGTPGQGATKTPDHAGLSAGFNKIRKKF
jgi:hypothetical protein